jgi:hypothetical protein
MRKAGFEFIKRPFFNFSPTLTFSLQLPNNSNFHFVSLQFQETIYLEIPYINYDTPSDCLEYLRHNPKMK